MKNKTLNRKSERFEMLMTRETKSALTRLALANNCSRAEWISRAINRAARIRFRDD